MTHELVALDLFAGTGWGVALQQRGIREGGVEIAPAAVASRTAAGMDTIYNDVWDGLLGDNPLRFWHALQIASPPCQSFSMAGKGAGRAALDDVLRAIDAHAYRQPERLRALGAETDDRTALVLTPLAHVYRDRPLYITWEQVPPVLPVWEACAVVLEQMGYSVWTGIMRAEQYGVPQTRRRAVLIARADGIAAAMPTPTHSRYYERDPQRLDAGVLPWVSMADALGFGDFELVGNQVPRGRERGDYHARPSTAPAQTLTGAGSRSWVLRSNYSAGSASHEAPEGNKLPRTERDVSQPATTITSKASAMAWVRRESLPEWCSTRPATTVVADPRLGGPGRSEFVKGGVSRQNRPGSLKLEVHEAALLQSYAADFPFQGGRGAVFLQIGNAVPPLMGGAIVDELVAPAAARSAAA
jgi:DNA (cytosine-5)-methyltransferase 1